MLHKDAQVDDDREVIIDDVEITRRFERVAESAKKQWEYLIEIGTGVGAYVDMLTYSHGNRVRQSENYSLTAKLSEVEDEIRSKRLALSELQEKWDETLMTLRRELDAAANETKEAYAGRERVTAEVHGLKVDLEQLDEEQQRTIEEYTRAEELVVLKEAKLVERRHVE